MGTPNQGHREQPSVAVLLATYNGMRFLPEQLDSIFAQRDVTVRVIAMDDGSSDGTAEWLRELALGEPRLTVLSDDGTSGSSAANFYRLIAAYRAKPDELVAFADQDDVWLPDKLSRHAALLAAGVDGVSSSVWSFTSDGKRTLVRKNYPQREWDFLLESPGPGCTFLMSPRLAALTAEVLRRDVDIAPQVDFHDSLIYAIARGHGWTWHIDGYPSVDYRQHDTNVMGSNVGLGSALARLKLIREHWLRNHAVKLTRVALRVAPAPRRAELERILGLLEGRGIRNRLALARMTASMRRRPRDRTIIGVLIAIGVW
ncbi:MAG: glycosyltransferase [Rhodoglobus sp.]